MRSNTPWRAISVVEVVLAAITVILDLFIPTLVILGVIILSLLARRAGLSTLGFKRDPNPLRMAAFALLCVVIGNLLTLGFVMPVLNHLTAATRDLSAFANLKGNLGQLPGYLAVAACGEEMVYRGWASLLAHGFGNSAGPVVFDWVGPLYGLC